MSDTETNFRSYHRYPVTYPVVFGGAPFVGEGTVQNLSLTGCSVTCDRTVLAGSYVRLSLILPDPTSSLFIELGKIRWARGNQFGVEFIRFPTLTRHRLDRVIEEQLTVLLESRIDSASHQKSPAVLQASPRRRLPTEQT
ncbi:MAG: PilZ domain-containing protein [Nitrospira sp.]|nr:PilZ domain-containing protein [Nitrospira sp.]